jgi:apolipoprotein N-acyltransferase
MTGARPYVAVFAAGLALTLAFPEPDLAPVAWVGLVPLLWLLRDVSPGRGATLGGVFGLGFFAALLFWIKLVGYVAWIVLVLLEAAFLALFAGGLAFVWSRLDKGWLVRIVVPAALWVVVEYARAMFPIFGFTWGELAQSQHNVGWLLRLAAFGGGWAVAFVLVVVNAAVGEGIAALRVRKRREVLVWAAVACAVVALPALLPRSTATGRPIRVAIVQGNVPRAFTGSVLDKELAIINSHARITTELAPSEPDLVVWPESSVGIDPERNAEVGAALASAARAVDAPMIVGANLDVDDDHYLVVALEISPEGEIVDRYQKTHLVPFGEYVPGRSFLDWIPMLDQVARDAIAGPVPRFFDVAGGKVAPVISFEGDFGSLVRRRMDIGGRLLVVATNTSTWGETWASAQHVAFSQVRAAENGVWVAHAAVSGISAFIAPDGTIVDHTHLWTADALVRDIRFATHVTFYARVGDWLPWTCLVGSLGALVIAFRRRPANTVA